jgi:uncharacterized protein YbjT (DUF2867 family)
MSSTIAVIGATGNQGSSVVSSLLSSTSFSVRAITRDPSSDAAKALGSDARLEVIQADLEDAESLKKAFEGVKAVFAMTVSGPNEIQQGRNLVDAIKVRSFPSNVC